VHSLLFEAAPLQAVGNVTPEVVGHQRRGAHQQLVVVFFFLLLLLYHLLLLFYGRHAVQPPIAGVAAGFGILRILRAFKVRGQFPTVVDIQVQPTGDVEKAAVVASAEQKFSACCE